MNKVENKSHIRKWAGGRNDIKTSLNQESSGDRVQVITSSYSRSLPVTNRDKSKGRKIAGSCALALPTLNAGDNFLEWLDALKRQTVLPGKLLLIDSASDDRTVEYAKEAGFEIIGIDRADFNHGGTRQMAVDRLDSYELILFMTQDAKFASSDSLELLLKAMDDERVGAAYGRQLPRKESSPIEAHARLFNYPEFSHVRDRDDISRFGIKTSFMSNSFAVWRRAALLDIGGFPDHLIQNEDAWAASRLIQTGWKIAYCSAATVYHSHGYSLMQEFRRYFDIGVFHADQSWIRESFGEAGGEGARFVRSEIKHLLRNRPMLIPSAVVRTGLKLIGYKLGNNYARLPGRLRGWLSSNKQYWRYRGKQ